MDGCLFLLLVVVLAACSPVLGGPRGPSCDKTDKKCQPIRPMKDFDEEKVNNN